MEYKTYPSRKAWEFVSIKVNEVLYHYNNGLFTTLHKKKIKNTKWPPKFFCLITFSETTYSILYLIKNMDTCFPGKVPKSGEFFGNYILSALIWREPQGSCSGDTFNRRFHLKMKKKTGKKPPKNPKKRPKKTREKGVTWLAHSSTLKWLVFF